MVTKIDGKLFATMIISAANNLENCKQRVNEMNVFPVPDGDTGTNMAKTMAAAAAEVSKNPTLDISELAKAVSSAALRGARGNSGVILSQLLRGLAKGIEGHETADVNAVADGFIEAKNVAYRAVMKPTEGTILTVARIAAETADKNRHIEDMCEFLTLVILAADKALKQTPEMLPVLKKAGVVDSGGMGLVKLLEGALFAALNGSEVELSEEQNTEFGSAPENLDSEDLHHASKFGYCTEFIILKNNPEKPASVIEKELKRIGDCVLVIDDDGFAKVHVHTDAPGVALTLALTIGSLTDIKIDNLREEEKAMKKAAAENAEPEKEFGFVGVCAGEGLSEILKSAGVDSIIEGGQTMNPCADDILRAAESVNAKTVFVFPNNKNIILAAHQAAEIESDKQLVIIPTKNVPQNITAMLSFNPDCSCEENEQAMNEAIKSVKTASVTYAVRDTEIEGISVKSGDIIGVADDGICCSEQTTREAVLASLKHIVDEDEHAVIGIYYGADVGPDEAEALAAELEDLYEDIDIELKCGGQPVYYYILSAE